MSKNIALHTARREKNDEFYTQLDDITNEMQHYTKHFKGKTVYCNCDDPRASNFFHYFSHRFIPLGLKKLIASCYKNQSRDFFSTHDVEKAVYLEYEGDKNENKKPDAEEIAVKKFKKNGDFRNPESIALLKQADIIVTNPPFSLFREYVAQLIEYDKKFIILGDQNAVAYKEIFKLIKENKLWLGVCNGGTKWFEVKEHFDTQTESRKKTIGKKKYFSMGRINWFTNLDIAKRHEDLNLYKVYKGNEKNYPTYDNYDAINVDKAKEIPMDYKGAMGVPITFLDKYNPAQFEIVGIDRALVEELTGKVSRFKINNKEIYARIIIKNRRI